MENGVEERSKKIGELAPVVGPSQGDSIVELIEGYERLAESLGAEADSGGTRPELFPYWETLSFEQADTYQPDLLLFDDRNYPANFDLLEKQPIARSIKAFAAGAYVQWPAYWLHTCSDYAKQPSPASWSRPGQRNPMIVARGRHHTRDTVSTV